MPKAGVTLSSTTTPSEQSGGQVCLQNQTPSRPPKHKAISYRPTFLPKQFPLTYEEDLIESKRSIYGITCNKLDYFVRQNKALTCKCIDMIVNYLTILDPKRRNIHIYIQTGFDRVGNYELGNYKECERDKIQLPTFSRYPRWIIPTSEYKIGNRYYELDLAIVIFEIEHEGFKHFVMGIARKDGDILFFDTLGLPPTKDFDIIMAHVFHNSYMNEQNIRSEKFNFPTKIEKLPHEKIFYYSNGEEMCRSMGAIRGPRICVLPIVQVDPAIYPHLDPKIKYDDPSASAYAICAIVRNFFFPMKILPLTHSNFVDIKCLILEDLYMNAFDFDDEFEMQIIDSSGIPTPIKISSGLTLYSHLIQLMQPPGKPVLDADRRAAYRARLKDKEKFRNLRSKEAKSIETKSAVIPVPTQPILPPFIPNNHAHPFQFKPQSTLLPINNLSGLPNNLQQITSINENYLRETIQDPAKKLLEAENVFAYCAYAGRLSTRKVLVISPRYTNSALNPQYYIDGAPPSFETMIQNSGQENKSIPEEARRYIYDGNRRGFDVVIIPVAYDNHYAMAIYNKLTHNLYYIDSLGWSIEQIKPRLFELINFLNGNNRSSDNMMITIPTEVNRQQSNYECGFYACLAAEGYLLYGKTFQQNLNFEEEFKRLTQMLLGLCKDTYPLYIKRT